MPTRFGENIALSTHVFPAFFYGWGSKGHIRHVKKLNQSLFKDTQEFLKADENLDIEAVLKYLDNFFKDQLEAEKEIHLVADDVYIVEDKGIKHMKPTLAALRGMIDDPNTPQEHLSELKNLESKFLSLIREEEKKQNEMTHEERDQKLGIDRLEHFDVREMFAVYFQMRMKANDMRRLSGKLHGDEHVAVKEIHKAIVNRDYDMIKKISSTFDKYEAHIKKFMDDCFFLEHMSTRVRHKLHNLTDQQKEKMDELRKDGFPKDDLDKVSQGIMAKYDGAIDSDTRKEFQASRVVAHEFSVLEDTKSEKPPKAKKSKQSKSQSIQPRKDRKMKRRTKAKKNSAKTKI